ncbi:MAG: phosphoadenylyl-sulfate reductase [Saprospirales bacterium]|nr:phosphoadenylyl-sulfate reductase [Saprospirales bacterium]
MEPIDTLLIDAKVKQAKSLKGQTPDLAFLNEVFSPLPALARIHLLYAFFKKEEVLVTSSFGANSAFLLYLISLAVSAQPIYFIDTTNHFQETLDYKKKLMKRFRLEVIDVLPDPEANARTKEEEWWKDQPKACCAINKVAPLEPIKARHKVWISGLMAFQTPFRAQLNVFEQQGSILKFHPLINYSQDQFEQEREEIGLPRHPLELQGYGSIGCTHCTERGEGRSGRWAGSGQTECGLHPGFFEDKR